MLLDCLPTWQIVFEPAPTSRECMATRVRAVQKPRSSLADVTDKGTASSLFWGEAHLERPSFSTAAVHIWSGVLVLMPCSCVQGLQRQLPGSPSAASRTSWAAAQPPLWASAAQWQCLRALAPLQAARAVHPLLVSPPLSTPEAPKADAPFVSARECPQRAAFNPHLPAASPGTAAAVPVRCLAESSDSRRLDCGCRQFPSAEGAGCRSICCSSSRCSCWPYRGRRGQCSAGRFQLSPCVSPGKPGTSIVFTGMAFMQPNHCHTAS